MYARSALLGEPGKQKRPESDSMVTKLHKADTSAKSGRISKDPDARRLEIMAAALEQFASHGYERTSVQSITESVGVAKGLFYHYFKSKADLLNQMVEWQADDFFASLPDHAELMEGDPLSKMRDVIGRIVQWKFEDIKPLTLAYVETMYSEQNTILRLKLSREYMFRLVPLFSEIIAEAVEEGLADAKDPETAAKMIFSLWLGLGDVLMELVLTLPGRPEVADELVGYMHSWEDAIERILGIESGTLQLYDYAYVRQVMLTLAAMDTGSHDLSKGDAS